MKNTIKTNWKEFVDIQAKNEYWSLLLEKVNNAYKSGDVYPKQEQIFNCFNFFDVEDTKVVIFGQDPYHGPNQANGLSFSVNENIPLPKSLKNMYRELENDLSVNKSSSSLECWAKQGVLLLNSCLTVDRGKPNSHSKFGWNIFTDNVIKFLNKNHQQIVYILLGNFAQSKAKFINHQKNFVFKSAHPSPLSAYNGFFGSRPFSATNEYLIKNGKKPINW